MAQAFFNKLSKKHTSFSAGTHAKERIDKSMPKDVVECMNALDTDISKHFRKQ